MEYVTLSSKVKMPILGYGVYQVTKDECEQCVLDALDAGYRSMAAARKKRTGSITGKNVGTMETKRLIFRGIFVNMAFGSDSGSLVRFA